MAMIDLESIRRSGSNTAPTDVRAFDDSEEDDNEILEESPCGRWFKRREEVKQRDVPGIDNAYLAMDTEEGVEVVWNEVQFSERKNFKSQEQKIRLVFDGLTKLDHPNIVKFHKYWTDTHNDQPRVIFITEYMSSGCLKQFLTRFKRSDCIRLPLSSWKRWCRQILSALSYLHSFNPAIVHGYLTSDTIFIQHNGLLKIGSIAPDTIHHHVKTCRDNIKNVHFIAPEYTNGTGSGGAVGTAMDIYSFGMCALEMAALEILGQTDSNVNAVTEHNIRRTIKCLTVWDEVHAEEGVKVGSLMIDFVEKCLSTDPSQRPTARQLLFHPALFEVPSLKLIAAHKLVKMCNEGNVELYGLKKVDSEDVSELVAEAMQRTWYSFDNETPIVVLKNYANEVKFVIHASDIRFPDDKLEKFVDDVRIGVYPIMVFVGSAYETRELSTLSDENGDGPSINNAKSTVQMSLVPENRKVINMMCNVKPKDSSLSAESTTKRSAEFLLTMLLRMEDKMNRQLSCSLTVSDNAAKLASELVQYAFIHPEDEAKVASLMDEAMSGVVSSYLHDSDPEAEENPASGSPTSSSGYRTSSCADVMLADHS